MAVTANTNETYDVSTIREDLSEAMASISPTETLLMSTIGTRNVDNTYFEWSEVDLAATGANRQIEGDVGLSNTAPTNAVRKGGYTQISAKVVEVSSTNQAVNGVANAQTVAKQVAYKLSELKRDMEAMLLSNVAAAAGSSVLLDRLQVCLPILLLTYRVEVVVLMVQLQVLVKADQLTLQLLMELYVLSQKHFSKA